MQRDVEFVGAAAFVAGDAKFIVLDEVVDGDRALMLLIGDAAPDRVLVERDFAEPFLPACRRLLPACGQ